MKYYPDPESLADAHLQAKDGQVFRKGGGCSKCHDSGFAGRMGVYEVMEVTPPMRKMIHRGAGSHDLREQMKQQGQLSLREEGVLVALAGKSSLEEVIGITHTEDASPAKHVEPAAEAVAA